MIFFGRTMPQPAFQDIRRYGLTGAFVALLCPCASAYELHPHPRIFVVPNGAKVLAARAAGPLRATYGDIKAVADRAVAGGVPKPRRGAETPLELVSLGI